MKSVVSESTENALQDLRVRAHPSCLVCGSARNGLNLEFTTSADGGVQAVFECRESFEGYTGVLHGGVVALLLDSAMTNCMFAHGIPAVTAELIVRFRHPVATCRAADVRARMYRSTSALYVLTAEVRQDEQIKAAAVGKFMNEASVTAGTQGSS